MQESATDQTEEVNLDCSATHTLALLARRLAACLSICLGHFGGLTGNRRREEASVRFLFSLRRSAAAGTLVMGDGRCALHDEAVSRRKGEDQAKWGCCPSLQLPTPPAAFPRPRPMEVRHLYFVKATETAMQITTLCLGLLA